MIARQACSTIPAVRHGLVQHLVQQLFGQVAVDPLVDVTLLGLARRATILADRLKRRQRGGTASLRIVRIRATKCSTR
jgi:hypothetical protein